MWCPCGAHILSDADPCSENAYVMGDLGRGALYAPSAVVTKNLRFAAPQQQEMLSGPKVVRDAHCRSCGKRLGWKYDQGLPDQMGNICLSDMLHQKGAARPEVETAACSPGAEDPTTPPPCPTRSLFHTFAAYFSGPASAVTSPSGSRSLSETEALAGPRRIFADKLPSELRASGGAKAFIVPDSLTPNGTGPTAFRYLSERATLRTATFVDDAGTTQHGKRRERCHKLSNFDLCNACNSTDDQDVKRFLVGWGYDSKNITRSTHNADHSRCERGLREEAPISARDFTDKADSMNTSLWHMKDQGEVGKRAVECILKMWTKQNGTTREFVASLKLSSFATPEMRRLISGSRTHCEHEKEARQLKQRAEEQRRERAEECRQAQHRRRQEQERRQREQEQESRQRERERRQAKQQEQERRKARQHREAQQQAQQCYERERERERRRERERQRSYSTYDDSPSYSSARTRHDSSGYSSGSRDGGSSYGRCQDGSRDMRFACNRGHSKY